MTHLIFGFLPSGWEIFMIVFVVLLLFGGKKIPELMRGLGKGIREFNSARATVEDEIRQGMDEDDKKKKNIDRSKESNSAQKEKTESKNQA